MDKTFRSGFDAVIESSPAYIGNAVSHEYAGRINDAITKLTDDINSFQGYNTPADRLQGDIAEFWHGGTFNINSAVNDSNYAVDIDRSHLFASPDIKGNWTGSDFGLKYYKTAEKSINAQASSYYQRFKIYRSSHPDASFDQFLSQRGIDIDTLPHNPIYTGQLRLIPVGQYEEALAYLDLKIAKEALTRPEQAARYQEVRDLLTTGITAPDGTSSIELDRKASERIARIAKEGNFSAKDEGLAIDNIVRFEHIVQQGVKAGLSASVITMVMKAAPSLYKCLDSLVSKGIITDESLEELGGAALNGAGEGFVRGFIAGTLTVACETGQFGVTIASLPPAVIGALTVIVFQTLQDSISFVKGTTTRSQLLNNLYKSLFVTGSAVGFGILTQSILPILPFSYLLGNMVGTFVGSFVYIGVEKAIMSFAVRHGWTFFSLVSQDYRLPDDVLREIGVDIFDYENFLPDEMSADRFKPDTIAADIPSHDMIRVVRRGVIGVYQIGYVNAP